MQFKNIQRWKRLSRLVLQGVVITLTCHALATSRTLAADYLIDKDKVEVTGAPSPAVGFTVRLTETGAITKAEATVGGKPAETKFEPIVTGKTLVYFLLDLSANDAVANSEKELLARLGDELVPPADFQVGLATIGSTFNHWYYTLPEKMARESTTSALAKEKKQPKSNIYAGAKDALEKIKTQSGVDRKVLVFLTPGKSDEPDARALQDSIIADAKKDGVLVFAVTYARTDPEKNGVLDLRRIAKETGGAVIETDAANRVMKQLTVELRSTLRSGAKISIDLKGASTGSQEMVVRLTRNDDHVLQVQRTIEVPAAGTTVNQGKGSPAPGTTPVVTPSPSPTPIDGGKKLPPWIWYAVGGGVVVLGGLIGLLVMLNRNGARHVVPEFPGGGDNPFPPLGPTDDPGFNPTGATEPDPAPGEPTQFLLGWLEEIDKAGVRGARHAISKSKLSIGRSEDSDLRFPHESVSVHHATVTRRSDGQMAIHDLETLNGVYLNGKRIEHSLIKDGDIVELGAIRLRLVLNQGPKPSSM